ncbi:alpha/beta fold hydrolase [Bradyrhizobium sp. Ai1a-2]|uniref:alpha/beta hydrolase family protein n=1 Tax=Bradyrhizobium sp. Ai1a-2 TaxID=196490 RepID=UPI000417DF19|nr:alpha/beta fold hydrolase [Bradyrhizobium sp. Ai1a-2]
MTILFKDKLQDEFGTWPLAYIPYGGADFGEIEAVARTVGSGDDSAYYAAWNAAADRLAQEAASALAKGHGESARDLYLRASVFYATSYHPLYGEPVDPRLLIAFRKQLYAFDRGLALSDPPVEPHCIAFGDASMPAYLIPAQGRAREVRPLLILTNGYDATITDMYFASAVAASRRGYHCLLFDGPGQGAMLYEYGIRLRPDWETVIAAVVDFALTQPIVDPDRIALSGWSLGGYLAPRAASKEHRIAALIADPGTWSMAGGFRDFVVNKLGATREAASDLGELDQPLLDHLDAIIKADRDLRWKVVQRGFWVHGVDNLRDYLRSAEQFTMEGHAELIRCPTLLTMPESDPIAAATPSFFHALGCRKTLMCFSANEGAGEHCEMRNRSLLNLRMLDWLDEQFS